MSAKIVQMNLEKSKTLMNHQALEIKLVLKFDAKCFYLIFAPS